MLHLNRLRLFAAGARRVALAAFSTLLVLCGCTGENPFGPLPDGGLPPDFDAGPSGTPVPLTVGIPVTPNIGTTGPFYVADVTPGQIYYVVIADAGRTITVAAFDDVDRTSTLALCQISGWGSCELTAASDAIYIDVHTSIGFELVELALVPSGAVGTALSPLPDASRTHPFFAMQTGESSYYVYDLAKAGSTFLGGIRYDPVGLTAGYAEITLYPGGDFTAPPLAGPISLNFGNVLQEVISNVASGPLGIEVQALGSGPTVWSLAFEEGLAEGAEGERVTLSVGTTHTGGTDDQATSYYAFTAPQDGGVELTFTGLQYPFLYPALAGGFSADDGTPITGGRCYLVNTLARCTVDGLSAGQTVFFDLTAYAPQNYTIDLAANTSEGNPASPVPLPLGVTHTGGVGANGNSYYTFTVPSTGGYEVVVTPLDGGAAPSIVVEEAYGTGDPYYPLCKGDGCYLTGLTAGQQLYVTVSSDSIADAAESYEITLVAVPGDVGSPDDRVVLTPGTIEDVSVGAAPASVLAESFYTFTTQNRVSGYVFVYWGTGTPYLQYVTSGGITVSSQLTGSPAHVIMRSLPANTVEPLRLSQYGVVAASTGQAMLVELHPDAGCSAAATHCWNFEDGLYPVEFTVPAMGTSGFDVDPASAMTGAYGIAAHTTGGSGNACLEVTIPEVSSLFAYTSSAPLNAFVDGSPVTPLSDTQAGPDRFLVVTTPSTGHSYALCQSYSSGGTTGISVDDVEVD